MPEFKGKYIFGDIVKGRVFFVESNDLKIGHQSTIREMKVAVNGKVTTLVEQCGAQKVDMRFGRDSKGELYVLTKPDGKVYRVIGMEKK